MKSYKKVHRKCNYFNCVDFQYIQFPKKTRYCFNCKKNLFPSTSINNYMLKQSRPITYYHDDNLTESCIALKPPKNL